LKKVTICVGTRPNFIKITQFEKYFSKQEDIIYELVHTGQHFDQNMSTIFFDQLKLKTPDVYLNATGKNQIDVMADILSKFQDYLDESKPDIVLVPGDVNSSLACAIVTNRNGIKLGHIESGLRSFDRTMPEEINRILIDELSDLHFVTEQSGMDNLIKEGKKKENIFFVGNTMIDSLVDFQEKIDKQTIIQDLNLPEEYAVLTFHRPSNVDYKEPLEILVKTIQSLSSHAHLVFSIHPRTMSKLKYFSLLNQIKDNSNITIIESLGYLDFMKLVKNASFILTDSGGIQEETSFLNIPCLTVRENTERPITLTTGTNQLIELNEEKILAESKKLIHASFNQLKSIIPKWDGNATQRIVDIINNFLIDNSKSYNS
jgi:UDP-N-acetylglucosamine 2-epimerase (non-hydrolysing)